MFFNLGNNSSESIMDIVRIIESKIGKNAKVNFEPIQLGDVKETYADIEKSKKKLGYFPKTDVKKGIIYFLDWYLEYSKR